MFGNSNAHNLTFTQPAHWLGFLPFDLLGHWILFLSKAYLNGGLRIQELRKKEKEKKLKWIIIFYSNILETFFLYKYINILKSTKGHNSSTEKVYKSTNSGILGN
jgi:hypothetical protein